MRVVVLKAGAGNFCARRFADSRTFEPEATEASRSQPVRAESDAQLRSGLAFHCHCRPSAAESNSSLVAGIVGATGEIAGGFFHVGTGSPLPSPSGSTPITGQPSFQIIGCK